jgi:hypothetical protein
VDDAKSAKNTKTARSAKKAAPKKAPAMKTAAPSVPAPRAPVRTPEIAPPLWARLVADPGFAPEHLAREAIARMGPAAMDWAVTMRARYPLATPDGLARLAAREFVGRAASLSGVGGLFGAIVGTSTLGYAQARLVLHIAAAYGLDATSEDRVKELLRLLRVPRLTEPTSAAALEIGRALSGWALRRAVRRLGPGAAPIVGAYLGARSSTELADRATAHYRRNGTLSRSSV